MTYVKIAPSQGKKDWRPKKVKEPDCASYEVGAARNFVGKSSFTHKFAAPKDSGAKQSKETYTTIISK